MGGASLVKPPPWAPRRYIETWKAHVHDDGTVINCAAFALVYMQLQRPDKNMARVMTLAKELMERMGWGSDIPIDALQQYIDKEAPTKRLTVLLPRINHQVHTTFTGREFEMDDKATHCLYLVYDLAQEHFAACQSPQQLFCNNRNSKVWRWCHVCLFAYNGSLRTCLCDNEEEVDALEERKKRRKLNKKCSTCGKYGDQCDDCPSTCRFCGVLYHRKSFDTDPHRCIVYHKETREDQTDFWKPGDGEETSIRKAKYQLWAYDLEAGIERVQDDYVLDFVTDDNGTFVQEHNEIKIHRIEKAVHKVNLVVFRNVFDPDSERVFFGDDALSKFVMFMMNHNYGKNICVAHNGSGYDTRLIFEEAIKLDPEFKIIPTARGCKFMQIQVGNTFFRDSLLHIRGSLANLAKDFFGQDAGLKKGHFPHLFNSVEHYDYVGPLPPREFFDLSFMIKNRQDLHEFDIWYNERKTKMWHFKSELIEYCKNDVWILARLMKEYHDILMDKFSLSPWFHATAPSYVHALMLHKLSENLELPDPKDHELYKETINKLAWEKHWGVLTPNEYWFARKALRGGRTEVRKVYHRVSEQDWARGVRIRYQDIVSMYPYVQVAREYPIGLPVIEVYDPDLYPCFEHRNPLEGNVVDLDCGCPVDKRRRLRERLSDIRELPAPTVEEILEDDSFFGIVCASLTPPVDLFHPVLVTWDEEAGKCIGSLVPIEKGVFTSVEFKVALREGYKLDKLHRLDRYHKAPGLWSDIIKDLYIHKMANSESTPSHTVQEHLVQQYEQHFGMGEAVEQSFPTWGANPAKKQTFKILLNSGWGKHAQRPVMPQTKVLDADAVDDMYALFKNLEHKTIRLQDFAHLGDKTFVKHSAYGDQVNPNLHHGYLPAALFVPAYGRLMLWEQLNKLGKRVLMHDTDSIVYIYDPATTNIPEGDVWGQWSVEKFDTKNGGIKTFVGLGPKSYALEAGNGKTMFKCKGVSIKLAHEQILNFEVMKCLVMDYLKYQKRSSVKVPQMNFIYRIGKNMITWKSLKEVSFQPDQLKGILDDDGVLYPFGYCMGCIMGLQNQEGHPCIMGE